MFALLAPLIGELGAAGGAALAARAGATAGGMAEGLASSAGRHVALSAAQQLGNRGNEQQQG